MPAVWTHKSVNGVTGWGGEPRRGSNRKIGREARLLHRAGLKRGCDDTESGLRADRVRVGLFWTYGYPRYFCKNLKTCHL